MFVPRRFTSRLLYPDFGEHRRIKIDHYTMEADLQSSCRERFPEATDGETHNRGYDPWLIRCSESLQRTRGMKAAEGATTVVIYKGDIGEERYDFHGQAVGRHR